jgi:uncharacterized membrane protein
VTVDEFVARAGQTVDILGVAAIVLGIAVSSGVAVDRLRRRRPGVYTQFRQWLGRSVLLGLELLVAADIIRTVATSPTLDSVAVLASIVAIRTFLSFSLELEINGRWPWQKAPDSRP